MWYFSYSAQAVTLSREGFKTEAVQIENIYKIEIFVSKLSILCGSIQTNLEMLKAVRLWETKVNRYSQRVQCA